MENKLRCHKILVTGGGSGIGKAIALRLASAGAAVTLLGRNPDRLEKARAEIPGDHAFTLQGDIAQTQEIPRYIARAAELMGGLDGVVNCAALGTTQVTGREFDPWDITPEEWDTLMDVNMKGAYFVMREAADYMVSHKIHGNILNISSNAACMDIVGSYGAAKLSIMRWTRAIAKRFGSHGIIINGIAPGATATPMISRYCKDENDPYPRHAIGRFIKPCEIAELAFYLMSEMGQIICGHTVIADGGDHAATL